MISRFARVYLTLSKNMKAQQLFILCCTILICRVSFAQKNQTTDTIAVNILLQQSVAQQTVNVDSCFVLAKKALGISERIKYLHGSKRAFIRMGSVMIAKGYNDSALSYLLKAKEISKSIGDLRSVAGVSLLLSYVYQAKGMEVSAFTVLYESLTFSQKEGNTQLTVQNFVALGDLYCNYKDYNKALKMYERALKMGKENMFEDDVLSALMGIGSVYYQDKKIKQALSVYLQADSLGKKIGNKLTVAQNLNNIALCCADLKQEQKALQYYDMALKEYKQEGMLQEEANLYYNLGCLYFDLKNSERAIYYLKQASALSQTLGLAEKLAECYQLMAKVYAQNGDFFEAYQHHEKFTMLSDSLMNSEKIRSISEMQTKYETELKSTQIKVLQRENDITKLKASRSLTVNIALGIALVAIIFVAFAFYSQSKKKQKLNTALAIEKKKTDDLLLNILPAEIADELKYAGTAKAKQYQNVTVMFTDFVNFTAISEQLSPNELVEEIHKNFTAFDGIMDEFGLEKIKTIGDAYLAVCGLPNATQNHAQQVIKAALAIQQFIQKNNVRFQIRIGIHTGPVVAGIVGVKKYAYDIWGDTVNTAARMEQNSQAGKINISGATYELVKNEFTCEHRGKIQAKNKGEVDMWFINQSFSVG